MTEFYRFAGEHYVLVVILVYIAIYAPLVYAMKIVNRAIRHLNIRKAGWPPAHLDADGDVIREDPETAHSRHFWVGRP